jgi:two-component system, cell cycle sensor histidine kinase and response regulator CckA
LLLLSIALAVILRVAESAGVRVENTTKRFQLFFARAATEAVTLEPEGLDFAEFRPLVDAANSMVTQRNVAETELREKEDQLRQSQKLEAVGQLAGGVAHDFNNVLTGIMGNASLLQINCAPDSEGAGYVSAILTASERAAALTRQLLDFSRKGRVRDVDTDLHALIADVEALLGRSLDPRVVISTRLEATSSVVRGDPAQLQNALLNLAINARDAMPDGGELVFATRDLQISPDGSGRGAFRDHILAAGHYVEVVVSDTGSGMDSEVLGRLFEPFFTTKAPGKGTGLGLAGVYGCVRSHAGVIRVESEPGQGTRFELLFPLAKRVASGTPTAPLSFPEATASGVGATVLVVDDEEMVRTLAVLALKKDGYEIVEAEDGLGAVAAVEAPAHLDLLLLDLIMPGLSGEQTLARVRALRPDLPVLVASGFSEPQTMQRVLTLDGVRGFLAKPYTVDELRRAVVLALAEPSPTE